MRKKKLKKFLELNLLSKAGSMFEYQVRYFTRYPNSSDRMKINGSSCFPVFADNSYEAREHAIKELRRLCDDELYFVRAQ